MPEGDVNNDRGDGSRGNRESAEQAPLRIFISYRHSAAGGWAHRLYDALEPRFGEDNVFLDDMSITPGTKWLEEIRSHGSASGVLLAVIGPEWARAMREKSKRDEDDQVVSEITAALRMRLEVIPAMVGNAGMPSERDLPRQLWPLLARQKIDLRPGRRWKDDVAELMAVLEGVAAGERRPVGVEAPWVPQVPLERANGESSPADDEDGPRRPTRKHYDEVLTFMLAGKVVPFLGPGSNSSGRDPWPEDDMPVLPDAEELARYLAHAFPIRATTAHLTEVSQYLLALGRATDLYATLTQSMTVPPELGPTPVHAFLARYLPRLQQLRVPEMRQQPMLIVTSNYDDALEKAFKREDLPYDLAVYMASGDDRGRFVHIPHDGDPEVISDGSKYDGFPIYSLDHGLDQLEHTVIVKIHGAVDAYGWEENYVVSENDYIDYLTHRPIEKVVPQQILAKLKHSYCLFLGYGMADWNLRVFLRRVFRGHFKNQAWAIQKHPSEVDETLWDRMGVTQLYAVPLVEYVQELAARLKPSATTPA
jgi:hypothetical protein